MKQFLIGGLTAAGLLFGGFAFTSMPVSAVDEQVCEPLDSGKIDTSGDPATVKVNAPAGKLIDGYCVKAGSVNQTVGGPVFIAVVPPQATVVVDYPGINSVSHYSLSYIDASPPAAVEFGAWVDDVKVCDATTFVRNRTVTTTPYKYENQAWVLDSANAVVTNETQTIPIAADQIVPCPTTPSSATPPASSAVTPPSVVVESAGPVPVAPTAVAPAGSVAAAPTQALPATGTSSWTLFLAGLVALLGGLGLVKLSHRIS